MDDQPTGVTGVTEWTSTAGRDHAGATEVIALDELLPPEDDDPAVRPLGDRLRARRRQLSSHRRAVAALVLALALSAGLGSRLTHDWRDHTARDAAADVLSVSAWTDASSATTDVGPRPSFSLAMRVANNGPRAVVLTGLVATDPGITTVATHRTVRLPARSTTDVVTRFRVQCATYAGQTGGSKETLHLLASLRTANGRDRSAALPLAFGYHNGADMTGNLCQISLDNALTESYAGPLPPRGGSFRFRLSVRPSPGERGAVLLGMGAPWQGVGDQSAGAGLPRSIRGDTIIVTTLPPFPCGATAPAIATDLTIDVGSADGLITTSTFVDLGGRFQRDVLRFIDASCPVVVTLDVHTGKTVGSDAVNRPPG